MADLRTFSTAEEAAEHILTKGPSGEIQDGHGNNISEFVARSLKGQFLSIESDSFASIGNMQRGVLLFFGYGGAGFSGVSGLVHISLSSISTKDFVGSNTEFAEGIPDGTTGTVNRLTLFLDPISGECYFENRHVSNTDIVFFKLKR